MRSDEKKWLACRDLTDLFGFAGDYLGERRAILFAVGCVRMADAALEQPIVARAVELVERFADGEAGDEERTRLHCEAHLAVTMTRGPTRAWAIVAKKLTGNWIFRDAMAVPFYVEEAVHGRNAPKSVNDLPPQYAELFHDILGNPFRNHQLKPRSKFPPPRAPGGSKPEDLIAKRKLPVCPKHWKSSTVAALAAGVYAERAFDRLPILADALEEAGCDNAEVLAHCRGDGPHCRGCWVVDLVLGKP